MKKVYLFTGLAATLVMAGCASNGDRYYVANQPAVTEPATIYCVQEGGQLEFATEHGERLTFCKVGDNDRVEQWQYYNEHHYHAKN